MTYKDACLQLKEKLKEELIVFFDANKNSALLRDQLSRVHSEVERWIKENDHRNDLARVKCGENCPYCCHLRVDLFIPELFTINNYLKNDVFSNDRELIYKRIKNIQSHGNPLDRKWWVKDKISCPFLVNNCCGIHEVRPMACRQVLTGAREKCIEALKNPKISMEEIYWGHSMNGYAMGHLALLETLMIFQKEPVAIELTTGISILYENDDIESKWWSGKFVFRSAQVTEQPIDIDN